MSKGPITIFDKSAIQMLNVDEAALFGQFYRVAITPLFYVETLADLEKEIDDGKTPEDVVGIIASKTANLTADPSAHHRLLALNDLHGGEIEMRGRPHIVGGRPVVRDGKQGIVFDEAPEAEALHRWQHHEFLGRHSVPRSPPSSSTGSGDEWWPPVRSTIATTVVHRCRDVDLKALRASLETLAIPILEQHEGELAALHAARNAVTACREQLAQVFKARALDEIRERVPDFPRLPIIDEVAGKAIYQPMARVRGLEQDRAAIRARMGLIERRDEGSVEEVWEENSLWYRVVAQSKASVVGKSTCRNGFVPCGGFCVSIEIGLFTNNAG